MFDEKIRLSILCSDSFQNLLFNQPYFCSHSDHLPPNNCVRRERQAYPVRGLTVPVKFLIEKKRIFPVTSEKTKVLTSGVLILIYLTRKTRGPNLHRVPHLRRDNFPLSFETFLRGPFYLVIPR